MSNKAAGIRLERRDNGMWEYLVWYGDYHIMQGARATQQEAYAAAAFRLAAAETTEATKVRESAS